MEHWLKIETFHSFNQRVTNSIIDNPAHLHCPEPHCLLESGWPLQQTIFKIQMGGRCQKAELNHLTVVNFWNEQPLSQSFCLCFYIIFPSLSFLQVRRGIHLPSPAQRAQYQAGFPQNCHLLENDLQSQLCCHQSFFSFLKEKSNFRNKGYTMLKTRQHLQPGKRHRLYFNQP